MDISFLKQLIASGESETLEFKKTIAELQQVGETLCAFLNTGHSGFVLLGVTARGRLLGQEVSDGTLQEVAAMLKKLEPTPQVVFSQIPLEGKKQILALQVSSQASLIPFAFRGRPYIRVGSTTSVMPQDRYQRLLVERTGNSFRWEKQIAVGRDLNDLDLDRFWKIVQAGIRLNRLPAIPGGDPMEVLERLELAIEHQLTHGALVLFGRPKRGDYPQCLLQMARFRGVDKSEFADEKRVYGNAFDLFDEGMQFLSRHLPMQGVFFSGNPQRQDIPLIPFDALREGLINAICHRDYTVYGASVYLAIYDDRVEISNMGRLPESLSLQSLKSPHTSIKRNPNIASLFFVAGLIENWGRGTQKIVSLCVEGGLSEPQFQEYGGAFYLIFPAPVQIGRYDAVFSEVSLTDRQRDVLLAVNRERKPSLRKLSELLPHLSERMIRSELMALKDQGVIESQGYARGAYWSVRQP